MLFTAVGLLCFVLLHIANAFMNTNHAVASHSKSNQGSTSSSVSHPPEVNTSTLSHDQKQPLLTLNSSLLANETNLALNPTAKLETTTQNVWTLDPKDANGNNNTFNQLLSLGLDQSEISIFGVGPGMFDIDFFQVNLTGEMLSKFKPGVGASSLTFTLKFSNFF